MRVLPAAIVLSIAAAALVPAMSPAATAADLQAQVPPLAQIVDRRQELILRLKPGAAQLRAEVNSPRDSRTHPQLWPLQQTYDEKGADSARVIPPARPSGRSCANGATLACSVQPGADNVCRNILGPTVKLWICSNGRWMLVPSGGR